MIDSVCPKATQGQLATVVPHKPIFAERCKPEMRMLVSCMLKASSKMVDQWKMPVWPSRTASALAVEQNGAFPVPVERLAFSGSSSEDSDFEEPPSDSENGGRTPPSSGCSSFGKDLKLLESAFPHSFHLPGLQASSRRLSSSSSSNSHIDASKPCAPPPTVLLRSQEYVPVPKSTNPRAVSRVDVARDNPFLGWEQYHPDLIQAVLAIPGHHFNVFSEQHISSTEAQIRVACDMLDGLQKDILIEF
jgi:hypothetical protein